MNQNRVHIFVEGKVQGVFFRQSTRVIAIKNNVTGWVKNLEDGRVEIMLEGKDEDVHRVAEWCKIGPANSRVDEIQINQEQYIGEHESFEVTY